MNILLNVVWLLFGGFWMTIGWLIFGLICCILIITIPFGLAAFRIAGYTFWPFGRTIVQRETAGVPSLIGNIIWVLFAGLWLALGHAITGALLCVTIVGIPLGLAHFKLIPVSLFPLGTKIVSTS